VNVHGNAKLLPVQRELMCQRVEDEGWTAIEAAEAAGCSERTCRRWLARWRAGEPMTDRSSAPHHVANRTPAKTVELIEKLRRLRWTSTRIATKLNMAVSTVGAVLRRLGLHRLSRLEPPEPPNRYERRHPGELIHVDIKKLGRFKTPGQRASKRTGGYRPNRNAGWEYVHVAVDDTSRVAYLEILDNETGAACAAFLERAVAWFADHGVVVQRVMTDNGAAYLSKIHTQTVQRLGIKHLRTRPYRPRTNGKAERFIQTMLHERVYAQVFANSQQRRRSLRRWVNDYNNHRPHGSLGRKPPITRLAPAT
jgi:transposase InsO family protein